MFQLDYFVFKTDFFWGGGCLQFFQLKKAYEKVFFDKFLT